MTERKLSSEEVPHKFSEWLLSMGCPAEIVPSVDKLTEMCKGQYYMVWRSLMEHVESKNIVRQKRLQVFCNDVKIYQDRTRFYKQNSSVIIPDELSLWKQQIELKEKLEEMEVKVLQSRQECQQLVDKVSSKLSHRNLARGQIDNIRRRTILLQQVAEELANRKANLVETKSIAEGLCRFDTDIDIESKLNSQIGKCTLTRRQNNRVRSTSLSGNTLHSSVASNNDDHNESSEEYLSLVKCSGEILWPLLCERRASLTSALNVNKTSESIIQNNRITPRWILSHTASLTCSLGLEALKNKEHIQKTRATLVDEIAQVNDHLSLSEDSCELLVLRCEHSCGQARVDTLRAILDDVTKQQGMFATHSDVTFHKNNGKQIAIIDKVIENKKDELKRVITSLNITEMKIHRVRDFLINMFNSFHSEGYPLHDKLGGLCMQQESVINLRLFYEERRQKRKNKMDLSIDFDSSDNRSFNETIDNGNPKYIDELRLYLNSFNLENNKKIVLESGEKVWVFETIQSLIDRFYTRLQDNSVTTTIICPSMNFAKNLQNILEKKEELSTVLRYLEDRKKHDMPVIDISTQKEHEELTIDKIKKCLNENLHKLQKVVKTLDLGKENLNIWSENQIRKHISPSRKIDGLKYMDYESYYLQNLKY